MTHTGISCFTASNIRIQHTDKQGLENGSPIAVRPILDQNRHNTKRKSDPCPVAFVAYSYFIRKAVAAASRNV